MGLGSYRMFRLLTILDTGAGPKFVRRNELLYEVGWYIWHDLLPDICYANNKPLHLVRTVKVPLKLGNLRVYIDFIVCLSLAAPATLDADFWNRFEEAIRPRKKPIELDDGSNMPIVRRPLKRLSASKPLPCEQEYDRTQGRTTTAVKAKENISILPNCQKQINVSSKRRGLAVLQPKAKLCEWYSLLYSNRVVQVESDIPFQILIANFSAIPKKIVKDQAVATVIPHLPHVLPSTATIAEVLGFADVHGTPKKSLDDVSAPKMSTLPWKLHIWINHIQLMI